MIMNILFYYRSTNHTVKMYFTYDYEYFVLYRSTNHTVKMYYYIYDDDYFS